MKCDFWVVVSITKLQCLGEATGRGGGHSGGRRCLQNGKRGRVSFISCRVRLLESQCSHLPHLRIHSHTQQLYISHRRAPRRGKKTERFPPPPPTAHLVVRIIPSNLEATEYSLVERPTNNRQGCQPRNKSNLCDTNLPISRVFVQLRWV